MKNEIRAIQINRQTINSLTGNVDNVKSLKSVLENKIKLLESEISISLISDGKVIQNRIFKL